MNDRAAIPDPLRRQVLLEAGHRCAIPTCKQVPVDIAHIQPWAECKTHEFENLIALCPTCHRRYDRNEIDRKSMLTYKRNLSLIAGRYGDLERRVLDYFIEQPGSSEVVLPGGLDLLLAYLVRDGLLRDTGKTGSVWISGIPAHKVYALTDQGHELIKRWREARELT